MSRKGFKVEDPKQKTLGTYVDLSDADDFIEADDPAQEKLDMISLGGLWVNTPKSGGAKYMSGNLGKVKILIFKNLGKTRKEHPDFNLCLAQRPKPPYGDDLVKTPSQEEQDKALAGI